jgi:hypothetical protein
MAERPVRDRYEEAPRRRRESESQPPRGNVIFGYLIPLVLIGLTIADFARDGQIDKYLIGADLIFGLGALGWRVDSIIEKYLDRRR